MTREEAKKYIKSKMCNNCGIYLGGGKCSDNCNVIEAIQALSQEPCEDAISREAVRQGMMKYGFTAPDMTVHEFVEDELPSVTQKSRCNKYAMNGSGSKYCDNCKYKRQTGHWIITPFSVTGRHYQCSECKYIHTFTYFEYCPKCGAKMVEPQESEK